MEAALNKLDLCSLIDDEVFKRRTIKGAKGEVILKDEMFRPECHLNVGARTLVRVWHHDLVDSMQRTSGTVLDLGGVKAYQIERHRHGKVDQCDIAIPVSFTRAIQFSFRADGTDFAAHCEVLRDYAQSAAQRLSANPVLKPLLYGPDDQDTGKIGACANWVTNGGGEDCDPARATPVPAGGAAQILASGTADPNVECAVFSEAVTAVFGDTFAPIVSPGGCHFVQPEHRVQIETGVTNGGDPPGVYGTDQNLDTDRAEFSLAGKAVVRYRAIRLPEFDIYASPYNDLNAAGQVRIGLKAETPRGIETDEETVLDAEDIVKAHKVIVQVLAKHFG